MKRNVLIIDKDPGALASFMEIIKNLKDSFKCKHVQNGRQAIEMLQHTTPDFIFIDNELSEMNALQVVSAIRFQTKLKETRVYLYSNYFRDETSKMARMLGATGCIEKSGEFSGLVYKFKAIFSPELLPSYVFLKNNQPGQFFCYNAVFLNTSGFDTEATQEPAYPRDVSLYGLPDNNKVHKGLHEKSVEINPVTLRGPVSSKQ